MSLLLTTIERVRSEINRQVGLYKLGKLVPRMVDILCNESEFDASFIQAVGRAFHRLETAVTVTPALIEDVVEELYQRYSKVRWQLIPV